MGNSHDMDDIDPANLHELDDDHGDFGSDVNRLEGAGEAIAAKHLEQAKKAKALAKRYSSGTTAKFLSKEWFKAMKPAPLNHVKNNWGKILMTTASAGALATAGGYVLSNAVDLVAVAKTALLGYPGWKILNGGGARLGFYTGHFLNAMNRDRFREIKTEPAGRWAGRATAFAAAFMGSVLGHTYMQSAVDVTVKLPSTITQGVGSAFVDTFTYQSNTAFDPIWETEDQAGCLYQEQINPDHECLEGPGSEGIEISVDPTIVTQQTQDGELSWFGRAWDATGLDIEFPDILPEAEDVNRWARDQFGLNPQ